MRFHHSTPLPQLLVEDVGRPHVRITMAAIWSYFLEAGMEVDDCIHCKFLSSYCTTHAHNSFRFDPTSYFGKSILQYPLWYRTGIIINFIYASIWIQKPYFLQKRIRSRLLSPNYHKRPHLVSLHNLIRNRIKPHSIPIPPPPPPIKPLHRHKTFFSLITISPSTPIIFRPPIPLPYGLSLPRRHPREGVG